MNFINIENTEAGKLVRSVTYSANLIHQFTGRMHIDGVVIESHSEFPLSCAINLIALYSAYLETKLEAATGADRAPILEEINLCKGRNYVRMQELVAAGVKVEYFQNSYDRPTNVVTSKKLTKTQVARAI